MSLRLPKGTFSSIDHHVVRNYSLSSGPDKDFYRISIKREEYPEAGLVSNYFHEKIQVGSKVEMIVPCGCFVLKNTDRPIILISGGVGLTPMISMLESILESCKNNFKKVIFIQCAKSPSNHAMKNYIDNLSNLARPNLTSHVFYSSFSKKTEITLNHTKVHFGRIDQKSLEDLVPQPVQNNEFYFCGPPAFMKSINDDLNNLKVPKDQINYEYFGPDL